MKEDIVNPFLTSLVDVMTAMARIELKPSEPRINKGFATKGEVAGLIEMRGLNAYGTMCIAFEERAIFNIAEHMLNTEYRSINQDVTDLVREITNMVTDGARPILGAKGYDFIMTTPAVVTGDRSLMCHRGDGENIVVEFTTEKGRVFVEICL